jgi:hypothetical protein
MDFKAILEKMAELDAGKVSEECGMPMTTPQAPTASPSVPPSMSINLNAQGLDSIESLMKLITKVNPDSLGGNVKEPTLPMITTEPSMASLRDKIMAKPAIGIADSDIDPTDNDEPEEEAFGNTPTGAPGPEIKPLSAAIPNGDDLHRKKKQYPATQPGDNPMAVESIKAQLEALLAEIKSK